MYKLQLNIRHKQIDIFNVRSNIISKNIKIKLLLFIYCIRIKIHLFKIALKKKNLVLKPLLLKLLLKVINRNVKRLTEILI